MSVTIVVRVIAMIAVAAVTAVSAIYVDVVHVIYVCVIEVIVVERVANFTSLIVQIILADVVRCSVLQSGDATKAAIGWNVVAKTSTAASSGSVPNTIICRTS